MRNRSALHALTLGGLLAIVGGCGPSTTGPTSESVGSSVLPGRPFKHLACRVWKAHDGRLYYALAVGYEDFEPTQPSLSCRFTYDIKWGGDLVVDGRQILPSPDRRLLALNPFGQREEILLTAPEAEIVGTGNAAQIWTEVVLPRLHRFEGGTTDGVRSGKWVYFDKAGVRAYEGAYREGKRDGEWVYHFPSGKVRAKISYRDGKRHGAWTRYDEQGGVTDLLTWKDDVPVERPARQVGLGSFEVIHPDGRIQGGLR